MEVSIFSSARRQSLFFQTKGVPLFMQLRYVQDALMYLFREVSSLSLEVWVKTNNFKR